MELALIGIVVLGLLAGGYATYGRFIARQFRLSDANQTPAVRHEDGVDFVPTRPFYLLGQHFSAIAAAGPIAGPILAAQQFGWLPCLLWIALGVVFIGAVHDLSTLVGSIRHDARSIAEIVRVQIGRRAWLAMMTFIWVALVYVILAFTDITAATFVGKTEELEGLATTFNRGGAVAMASTLYLLLSVVMGFVERFLRPPLWLTTVVFVPATLGCVWLGTRFSTVLEATPLTWGLIILAYCFAASLTPVWALLQPRGYLGGFVLYMALAVGVIGLFLGGHPIEQPAFRGWDAGGATGTLFPFLFVTIACGACSGFHGLVCSGTTSKQVQKESHCHPIGYGAMLLEGFVALIALATVMIATPAELKGLGPGAIYGAGLGKFVTTIIGEEHLLFATTFGAMAFSTFVFDTIDVSTRLGRYILQELTGLRGRAGALLGTALTVVVPGIFLVLAGEGAYRLFWTLFGTSNQLLAALSLLGISVWLRRLGRPNLYTLLPMAFVMTVTVTSLALQVRAAFFAGAVGAAASAGSAAAGAAATGASITNGIVAALLLALAVVLAIEAMRAIRQPAGASGEHAA